MSFRLFPNSPSVRDLFDREGIRREWRSGGPVVTQLIIAVCVVVWLLEIVGRFLFPPLLSAILSANMFVPMWTPYRPWTLVTSMFLHEPGLFHILFNMLSLWCVGPLLERMMGHWRFLGLYLLSGLGGDVAMLLGCRLAGGQAWLTGSYGASGAIFGLFAAILVVYRRIGADIGSMLIWMAINFAMPFVMPNIAWQAHIGGFVVGGAYVWLLVSGVPALRRYGFTARAMIYGLPVLVILALVGGWCVMPLLG